MQAIIRFIVVVSALLISILSAFAQDNTNDKSDFPLLKGPYLGQKPPGMTLE